MNRWSTRDPRTVIRTTSHVREEVQRPIGITSRIRQGIQTEIVDRNGIETIQRNDVQPLRIAGASTRRIFDLDASYCAGRLRGCRVVDPGRLSETQQRREVTLSHRGGGYGEQLWFWITVLQSFIGEQEKRSITAIVNLKCRPDHSEPPKRL